MRYTMNIRRHLYNEIIDKLAIIGSEWNSGSPNNRKVSKLIKTIENILEPRIGDTQSTIDVLVRCTKQNGDLKATLSQELEKYGVGIVDKPINAEVLEEYFTDLGNKDRVITAYKIINDKGRCEDCKCYNCPFSRKNLTTDFSINYVGSCENFGRTYHTVDTSKRLVESAKEYIELYEINLTKQ